MAVPHHKTYLYQSMCGEHTCVYATLCQKPYGYTTKQTIVYNFVSTNWNSVFHHKHLRTARNQKQTNKQQSTLTYNTLNTWSHKQQTNNNKGFTETVDLVALPTWLIAVKTGLLLQCTVGVRNGPPTQQCCVWCCFLCFGGKVLLAGLGLQWNSQLLTFSRWYLGVV